MPLFTNVLEGEFSEVRGYKLQPNYAPVLCVIPRDRSYLLGGPGPLGPGPSHNGTAERVPGGSGVDPKIMEGPTGDLPPITR